ncbi:hypothetical protein AVEN_198045-1 [Araneus ventricosus]|uniref:Uncharacterized protein n=1 Tax=Araneus ventricosus TaxID=182803 RepID=A0A4Y2GMW0_ARAVE|nr:hypothetical protein AVEN_198045-1 [Araneus ventricosus]
MYNDKPVYNDIFFGPGGIPIHSMHFEPTYSDNHFLNATPLAMLTVANFDIMRRKEFYRGMYENTGRMDPSTTTLAINLATILATLVTKCGISKVLEFSLLGAEIWIYPDDYM